MFSGRLGRFSATAANPSLIAVSCPNSSRYHRTLSRNLTRLPTPLAVSLHRTVGGGWFAPSSRLPPCRRLGLHRPGGDGTGPWRGSDNPLTARTACRPTECTAARQPAPRASRLRVRAPDFEPGRCRGVRKDRTTRVGEQRMSGGNRLLTARYFSVARNSPERGHERDRDDHLCPWCLSP